MLSRLIHGNIDFASAVVYIISSLVVIFLTLPIHEFAHGFAADKLGDKTPKYQGRLTLNPFAHIDYLGALCILFFGFGWAKPVQVDARNFKRPKRDMAITALAGPLANVIVAFVALLFTNGLSLLYASVHTKLVYYAFFLFYYIAQINVYLAVFNLIPIPPLDGSRLLSAFLPNKQYYALMRYERYIFIALLALLWLGWLDIPLQFLSNGLMNGLDFVASLPFNLFGKGGM